MRHRSRGTVRLYRDLIRLRRNLAGHSKGLSGQNVDIFHADDEGKIVAFRRWAEGGAGDDTVVVMNFANVQHTEHILGFPAAGRWRLRFNSDAAVYGDGFGLHPSGDAEAVQGEHGGMPASAAISIAPYSCLIYSQE